MGKYKPEAKPAVKQKDIQKNVCRCKVPHRVICGKGVCRCGNCGKPINKTESI